MNLALNPEDGDDPAYGQIFIVDTEHAMRALRHANVGIDPQLLRTAYEVIRNVNPFAEAYMMMKEEEDNENERARNEKREPAEIKLLFETGRQLDRRLGYNVPRANEVAAVYVPGADGEVPNAKIVVRERGKELKILKSTDSMVTPMTYPLFYPRGTLGWNPEMKHRNSNRRITRLQYVCYTLAIREREFNPILYGGKLFQQYCVDEYVKIEGDRMNWIKCNQKKILADAYKNVDNMLMRRAQERGLPLGRKVILPPSMTNSPRYVEKHFQDAMAVVRRFGKPDMFLTMKCNPQWEEISENLFHEQKSSDRPDLVVRVFNLKVKAIMNEVAKKKIFGEVIAWMYPVENQGRGLPHIHLLLTLAEQDKLINGEDVEIKGISARIPDKELVPDLFDLVKRFMIHGPCGNLNPNCPCMEEFVDKNGMRGRKCSKGYPKAFQEETVVLENGLALYARPNDGRIVQVFANGRRHELDNRWVVPHNLYLLKMFKCHINLEKVNSVSSVKYLHKYVHKPPDRARLELEEKNDHDEVKEFIDARYVCPQEAVWRIFELPMYDRSHCIMSLPVHLQGEHICYFDENMEEEEIRKRIANGSELMAYFELNKTNVVAKTLFYHQIPEKFCFKKGKWTERKAYFNTIGRMVKVSPAEPERYHLRLLLLNVKGACSYDDLKSVIDTNGNAKVCETFSAACLERGLIRNDEEWKRALEEAESFEMPWKLREFFALILVHCNPAKPEELWNMFKDSLSEDFSRRFRKEVAYAKAYKEIALSIMKAGKTLADFPTMEQINVDDDVDQVFDLAEELDLGQRDYALMYAEQREICDEILHRIWNPVNEPAFYFLSGPGGTGKTHVNKTIVHMLRGQKKKVCTMAFTGIAATLLPAGRTLHNRFGLTLDMSNSSISPRSRAWQELKDTDLFICDEAPMINKRAMRTLDEKLREIMNNRIAFGGKVMLWTGDFRQTLPIQRHATRAEVVNSTLKRSEYWRLAKRYKLTKNMRALATEQEFARDLLEIGSGKWNNENDEIILPENCISNGDLAEEIFGQCIVLENWNEMAKSAILAPKNIDVSEMNNKVLEMLSGEEIVYTSIDLAQDENRQRADDYLDEYLNALNPSGFPRHKLRLKKNAIVLLMRNLNIEMGLCNGARMKVEQMQPNLIVCKILTGDKAGQTVYIPRITLCCSEDYPFDLHRHQFPLVLAFAMTINKAQGQTLEQVGIDLRKDVFSHGQLYVALSRARAWNKLRIRLDDGNLERKTNLLLFGLLKKVRTQFKTEMPAREDAKGKRHFSRGLKRVGDASSEKECQGFVGNSSRKTPNTSRWSLIWCLSRYCELYWRWLALAFFFLLTESIAQVCMPLFIARVISVMVRANQMSELVNSVLILTGTTVLATVAGGLRVGTFHFVTAKINRQMRHDLFHSITAQGIDFFDNSPTGEILSRLISDCESVSSTLSSSVDVFFSNGLMVLGSLVLMLESSWQLSLITLILIPTLAVFIKVYSVYYDNIAERSQMSKANANRIAEEAISSMRSVRAFAAERRERQRFEAELDATLRVDRTKSFALVGSHWLNEFANNLILLKLGGNFYQLSSVANRLMESIGASRKVFEYLSRQPMNSFEIGKVRPTPVTGTLEFRCVTFVYPTRPNIFVLKNVSFIVRPGEMVALVGPSGAGKSTVFSLLERFYEPTQGQILLDGIPITRWEHIYYHHKVSLVPQEPILYSCSIRDNILYGFDNPSAEDEDGGDAAVNAAKMANIHDYVEEETEKGYDTKCGEKGVQLSGGQKQRIAIARALVRQPKVLLLDEATSALDARNEQLIRESLSACAKGRTVLMIAHRLSTVRRADRILVMEHGQIVQDGNHAELMKLKDGLYYSMVQKQMGEMLENQ
ncbi:hypothetical protein niasHT_010361 [Heterodera trifolii]|uniref:ATP-dependent DNA helicase n=2 Tax=Heterodera trifolii TaxID=157864 RepID=A0ABD2M6X9_9BILA